MRTTPFSIWKFNKFITNLNLAPLQISTRWTCRTWPPWPPSPATEMESNRSVQVSRPNRNFLSPFFGFVDWMSFCRGRVKWFRLFRLHRCMSFLDYLPPRWIFYLKNKEKDNFGWKLFLGQNCLNIWCILGFKLDWKLFFWFRCCLIYFLISFSYFAIWLFYIWVCGVLCCGGACPFLPPAPPGPYFSHPPKPLPFFINPPTQNDVVIRNSFHARRRHCTRDSLSWPLGSSCR